MINKNLCSFLDTSSSKQRTVEIFFVKSWPKNNKQLQANNDGCDDIDEYWQTRAFMTWAFHFLDSTRDKKLRSTPYYDKGWNYQNWNRPGEIEVFEILWIKQWSKQGQQCDENENKLSGFSIESMYFLSSWVDQWYNTDGKYPKQWKKWKQKINFVFNRCLDRYFFSSVFYHRYSYYLVTLRCTVCVFYVM